LFRTGLTPLAPALEKNQIGKITEAIDKAAVEYVTGGASAIQMVEIVNTEIKTIRSCDSTYKAEAMKSLQSTVSKLYTTHDRTSGKNLYSGN